MRVARAFSAGRGLGVVALCLPGLARAAEVDGRSLSVWWGLPFAGLLLSIALLPLVQPRLWHHHFGKITAFWAGAFLLPFARVWGVPEAVAAFAHALVAEYVPFIILLAALFTVAGGIHVHGHLRGSPGLNVRLLALGAVLASVMGTTGASMLMIRPLIRANQHRKQVAHVVVFFIFIVSNIGGSLTPLGDPPLFLGFLKGVDFFWTAQHVFPETLFLVTALLVIFYAVDTYWFRREGIAVVGLEANTPRLGVLGRLNLLWLAVIVALVLMSGMWNPGVTVNVLGTPLPLQQLVRDGLLLGVIGLSMATTPTAVRTANQYSWGPMAEVAKLFAGIFLTMVPVLAMLKAGAAGPFAAVTHAVTDGQGQPLPWAYFWFAGGLSSFLDNAPTYLVFFNLAGGDPQALMTTWAPVLAAISAGSVFMGANTYIGNAPNFMVKAIAEERGIRMPSFFGYMVWSGCVLLPLFVVVTFIWFR